MIVVDASVLVDFLSDDSEEGVVDQVLLADPGWAVPFLWRSEFANFLATGMRRGALDLEKSLVLFGMARELVAGREHAVSPERVLRACAASGCTAYDCEYAVLAESLGVPLVTGDRQLLKAFPGLAVAPAAFVRG